MKDESRNDMFIHIVHFYQSQEEVSAFSEMVETEKAPCEVAVAKNPVL